MRTMTTLIVLALASVAYAQPAPFPPSFSLNVIYPDYPQGGGALLFAWDGQQYVHTGNGTSGIIGAVPEWGLPQTTDGGIQWANTMEYIDFGATWLADGRLRVDHVNHPTILITGPGNTPEPLLGAAGLGLLALRSRRSAR